MFLKKPSTLRYLGFFFIVVILFVIQTPSSVAVRENIEKEESLLVPSSPETDGSQASGEISSEPKIPLQKRPLFLEIPSPSLPTSETEESENDSPSVKNTTLESWPVTYNEHVAFALSDSGQQKRAQKRAKEASTALSFAIEAKFPKEKDALISNAIVHADSNPPLATLMVRGYPITTLNLEDARLAGFSNLKDFSDHLSTLMNDFVTKQRQKAKLQDSFMRFFLSVFFALIGFVVLRQARRLFNNLDHVIDQKKGSLQPLSIMKETVLTGETIGGLLAIGLAVGRIFSYLVIVVLAISSILSQFDYTRGLLSRWISSGVSGLFNGFEAFVGFFPGLFLSIILIFIAQAVLRILDLFLKGVNNGRIVWSLIPPHRTEVVRVLAKITITLSFGPFVLASLFGHFQTPYETLLIIGASIIFLSTLPLLINGAIGLNMVWKLKIKPGEWIKIGNTQGEVSKINLGDLSLVPLEGGMIHIPMVKLAYESVYHQEAPKAEIHLAVRSKESVKTMMSDIQSFIDPKLNPQLYLLGIQNQNFQFKVLLNTLSPQTLQGALVELITQLEESDYDLLTCQVIKTNQ